MRQKIASGKKRMQRRAVFLAAAGVFAVCAMCVTFTAHAAEKVEVSEYGYIRNAVPASVRQKESFFARRRENLPEKYDLRDFGRVSTVKDQKPWNTCWAFSALDSIQSGLIAAGEAGVRELPDLSERHLTWFAFGANDGGDALVLPDGVSAFNMGGNPYMAAATLSSWCGAVDEALAPYATGADSSALSLSGELKERSDYRLKNLLFLAETCVFDTDEPVPGQDNGYRLSADAVAEVKRAVMEHGAVGVSLRANIAAGGTVYTDVYEYADHEVTIIGWDDSFAKENFEEEPPGDGAWLAKNSWGETSGDGGYLSISYYDRTLCEFAVYEAEKFSEEEQKYWDNYQYDHVGNGIYYTVPAEEESRTFANVFTAERDCSLVQVSAYSTSQGAQADIAVYLNPEKDDPESGEFAAQFTETLDNAGYHTIALPREIALSKGQTFSVTQTIRTGDGQYELPVEVGYMTGYSGLFSIRASIEAGQSYVKRGDAGWKDLAESPIVPYSGENRLYTANAMIKAFARSTVLKDTEADDGSGEKEPEISPGDDGRTSANAQTEPEVSLSDRKSESDAENISGALRETGGTKDGKTERFGDVTVKPVASGDDMTVAAGAYLLLFILMAGLIFPCLYASFGKKYTV